MICPWDVSTTESREVREDGINITRLSIDEVIFQGYLEGDLFSLRELGYDIFADGR